MKKGFLKIVTISLVILTGSYSMAETCANNIDEVKASSEIMMILKAQDKTPDSIFTTWTDKSNEEANKSLGIKIVIHKDGVYEIYAMGGEEPVDRNNGQICAIDGNIVLSTEMMKVPMPNLDRVRFNFADGQSYSTDEEVEQAEGGPILDLQPEKSAL